MLTDQTTSPGDEFARRSLAVMFDEANENKEANRARVRKLLRQISVDMLAMEWLNSEQKTIENRTYLIGNVLPQVVLGLEHILKEAVDRRLIGPNATEDAVRSEGADRNFNPINRLAEFLMRNNHKYSHFCETSPYVRGLRNTVAKLQEEMFMRSDNPLAKLKTAVAKKKQEQAAKQLADQEEYAHRERCVTELFDQFLANGHETVQASVIHNAIYVFLELSVKVPDSIRKCLIPIFDTKVTEEAVKVYTRSEFVLFVMIHAKPMTTPVFEQFIEHLRLCASEYRHTLEKEGTKNLLITFFLSCDVDQSDILSRDKMLSLCDTYFGSAPPEVKVMLRNPRDWPVREYHLRIGRPKSDEPVETKDEQQLTDQKKNEDYSLDQNNSAAVDFIETRFELESETVKEELVREKQAVDEDHILALNQAGDTMNANDENDHMKQDDNEKQFHESLEVGQTIEKQRTIEDLVNSLSARSRTVIRSTSRNSIRHFRYGYKREQLTLLQFLHLIDNFITNEAPVCVVKDFVRYLESCYKESAEERCLKFQKKSQAVYGQKIRESIKELFDVLDVDSSGLIDLNNVEKIFSQFENGAVYVEALNRANIDFLNRLHSSRVRSCSVHSRKVVHGTTPNSVGQSPLSGQTERPTRARSFIYERHKLNYPEFTEVMTNVFCTTENLLSEEEQQQRLTDVQRLIEFVRDKYGNPCLEEQLRIQTRHKWLRSIETAAEKSDFSMQEVYKKVFQAVVKDALQFGKGKRISANISILQSDNKQNQVALRCVAAVPETEAQRIVDKFMYPNTPNISFEALKTGKMIHIPELTEQNIANIHLWDETKCAQETENSFSQADQLSSNSRVPCYGTGASCVVLPISNPLRKMIGILGIDTLAGEHNQSGFEAHELQFYQGVADRLGRAHSLIGIRRLFTQTARSAFEWLAYQFPRLEQIALYRCRDKPSPGVMDCATQRQCVLQRLVSKDQRGPATIHQDAKVIERDDNYCMNYLFNVTDTSDPSNTIVLGKQHLVYPLRDSEDVTFCLIDLCTSSTDDLSVPESDHVITMLGVLNLTYQDLVRKRGLESMDRLILDECEQSNHDSEYTAMAESPILETQQPETTFDQLMQFELKNLQCKITEELFCELVTYVNPPPVIVQVVHVFVLLILPDTVLKQSETKNLWKSYRHLMDKGLEKQVLQFNPSFSWSPETLSAVEKLFIDFTQDDLDQCRSGPVQLIYQWIRCYRTVFYNQLTNSKCTQNHVNNN